MRKVALGVVVALCACLPFAGPGSAAPKKGEPAVVFTVKPEKSSYSEGEAMLLLLGLQNNSRQTIIADANFALGHTIQVNVTGPNGQKIDWQSSFATRDPGYQSLSPGGSFTRVVCLNCRAKDPFHYPFGQPGTYTIRMKYLPSALTPAERGGFLQAASLSQPLAAAPFEIHVTPAVVHLLAEPAKSTFRLGEPIRFTFRLRNISDQSVLTAYDLPLLHALSVKVTNASGEEMPWRGKAATGTPLISTLGPKSEVESYYSITPQNLFGTITRGVEVNKPGTYTVHAVYDLNESISVLQGYIGLQPVLIIPGPIAAPPAKFTVLPAAPSSQGNP